MAMSFSRRVCTSSAYATALVQRGDMKYFQNGVVMTRFCNRLMMDVIGGRTYTSTTAQVAEKENVSGKVAEQMDKDTKIAQLSFAEYRSIRNKATTIGRVVGLPSAGLGMLATSFVLVTQFGDILEPPVDGAEVPLVYGMDPMIFSSLLGMLGGFVGYNCGAQLGKFSWRLCNRPLSRRIEELDADFSMRILKHRASGFKQGDIDYYGEKIRTTIDYRKWLKVQRKKKHEQAVYEARISGTPLPERKPLVAPKS